MARWFATSFVLLFCVVVAGCGKSTGSVSGKITYKNETLGGGTVTFVTADGKNGGSSTIGRDGTYAIANVPLGDVKIAIETNSAQAVPPPKFIPKTPDNLPPEAQKSFYYKKGPQGKYVPIPDHYANTEKSGLLLTVKGGAQPHDIDLK